MKYKIFCGAKKTMESYAARGVRGLSRKTMRRQVVDKTAKYEVLPGNGVLAWLTSDKPLYQIASEKGLII